MFYEEQSLYSDYGGVAFDKGEGEEIAKALGDKRTAILQNHGLLTTGQTVDVAAWLFISMDKCCQSQLLAEAAGKPIIIGDEMAEHAKKQAGTDLILSTVINMFCVFIFKMSFFNTLLRSFVFESAIILQWYELYISNNLPAYRSSSI